MRIGVDARSLGREETGPGVYTRMLVTQMAALAPEHEFHLFHGESMAVPEIIDVRGTVGVGETMGQRNPASAGSASAPRRNVVSHLLGRPGGRKMGNLIFEQILLPNAVSRLRCDVLWSPVFILPLWKNVQQVVTVHDTIPLLFAREFSVARRTVYNTLLRWNVARADRVVTVSHASAADIVRLLGVDRARIDVIPNGVDASFRPLGPGEEPAVDRLLRRHHIDDSFVLSTAGLLPRKNAHRVLLAFAELTRRSDTRSPKLLVFTGRRTATGNERFWRFLDAEAQREGIADRIRFTDHLTRDELRLLYARAAFSVYASLYEGFGFPILEAMACGCPVITSSRSSMPEVAGGAASLVDPESVEDLTDAMASVWGDSLLREGLIQRGFMRARAFRWEESARALLSTFERFAAQDAAPPRAEAA